MNGPHIVIVPKSTMGNWKNEFKKWVPSMDVVTFHGNKDERVSRFAYWSLAVSHVHV